jgi:hypothetical protein
MSVIRLEGGKAYKDREGRVVIIEIAAGSSDYCGTYEFWGDNNCSYTADGTEFDDDVESRYDLVEEVKLKTLQSGTIIHKTPIDFAEDYPTAKMSCDDYLTFVEGLFESMLELITTKNKDYTAGGSAFANADKAIEYGVDPMVGVLLRMEDKMQRVRSYIKSGELAVKGEGIEEAFKDIIGYSSMCLGMLEQGKGGGDE